MAAKGNVTPRADQPRVSAASLKQMQGPTTLQYRQTGITSYGNRSSNKRSGRETGRG